MKINKKVIRVMSFIYYLIFMFIDTYSQSQPNFNSLNFSIDRLCKVEGINDSVLYSKLITDMVGNIILSYQQQKEFNFYRNYQSPQKYKADVRLELIYGSREGNENIFRDGGGKPKKFKYFLKTLMKETTTDSVLYHTISFYENIFPKNKQTLFEILKNSMRGNPIIANMLYPPSRPIKIENKPTYFRTISLNKEFLVGDGTNKKYAIMFTQLLNNFLVYKQSFCEYNYYDNYQNTKKFDADYNVEGKIKFDKENNKYEISITLYKGSLTLIEQVSYLDKHIVEKPNMTAIVMTFQEFPAEFNLYFKYTNPNPKKIDD